jgi:hypothetical protein
VERTLTAERKDGGRFAVNVRIGMPRTSDRGTWACSTLVKEGGLEAWSAYRNQVVDGAGNNA